ncbi:reductive dehalogenase [Dehalogenimonas lykanthroporepellens BL-DC-9]|nr:reductive dehalogenase [Dehalogenimonas lykanthroporepellens BL-DC-9]
MGKFHHTVSRRDFMKGLGLSAAGLGAATVANPGFHDLDEVTSSAGGELKRAWWVSERDFGDPATLEIDWDMVQRADRSKIQTFPYRASQHPTAVYGRENYDRLVKETIQHAAPDWEGDSIRDLAVNGASSVLSFYNYYNPAGKTMFMGYQNVATPEQRGMARWEGTAEENTRMLRHVARYFGASSVGVTLLDEDTKKLIFARESNGKAYNFVDDDTLAETDTEYRIPSRFKYMVTWTHLQPTELTLREPANLGRSATFQAYSRLPFISVQIQEFIRGLGYHGINAWSGEMAPSNPFGALSGVGEHSRFGFAIITPELGSMVRGMCRMLTDLPLEPTRPIDAGISRFCLNCATCAKFCAFNALSLEDPSWESLKEADTGVPYSPDGFKGWRLNTVSCSNCAGCQAFCPFNSSGRSSFIHEFVAGTSSITPIFNGFFANMEEMMHYGNKDPRTWWENEEYLYGINPKFI